MTRQNFKKSQVNPKKEPTRQLRRKGNHNIDMFKFNDKNKNNNSKSKNRGSAAGAVKAGSATSPRFLALGDIIEHLSKHFSRVRSPSEAYY